MDTSTVNMNEVLRTLGEFRVMYGRYPCPASLSAVAGDVDYGHESDCTNTAVAPGDCADGICIKNSIRSVTLPDTTVTVPRVRVGGVPFRSLGLDESAMVDGHGIRMTYAVTELLTDKDTFLSSLGGVDIVDGQTPPQSLLPIPGSGHFVMIGHGPNKSGGIGINGVEQADCPDASVLEGMNCSDNIDAVFRFAPYSESNDENYFDDSVQYFARTDSSPWELVPNAAGDMIHATMLATGGMGVRVAADSVVTNKVMVEGSIRAQDNALAVAYCMAGDTNCLPPYLIGGDIASGGGLGCPSGQYMIGIRNGQADCADDLIQQCPTGRVMSGVDASGAIICNSPPPESCPAYNVTACGELKTLAARSHNQTYTINAGASFWQTFRCEDGGWRSISSGGLCTCTPRTQTRNVSCGAGFQNGGTYTQTREFQCPAGRWTSWTPSNANGVSTCTCINDSRDRTLACPTNYTGTHTQQQTWTCTGPNTGTLGPWTTISNTCTCEVRTQTRNIGCGSGLSGNIRQQRVSQCPSGAWGSWAEISNSCSCTPRSETKSGSCPDGYQGSTTLTRNFQCPSATWSSWTETASNCTVIPPVVCTWVAPPGGSVTESTRRGGSIGSTCTCGNSGSCNRRAGGGMYPNYGGCNCK